MISSMWKRLQIGISATVFTLFEPITAKWHLFKEVPLFDALDRGEPLHPVARNFVTINERPEGSPRLRFRDPSLHRFDTDHECDRRTDRRTPRRWQRRTKHSAFGRKKWTLLMSHYRQHNVVLFSRFCDMGLYTCRPSLLLHRSFFVSRRNSFNICSNRQSDGRCHRELYHAWLTAAPLVR